MAETGARKSAVIDCQDLGQTQALATVLAARIEPGFVLLLDGDLGAGKTAFIQGLCEALEVSGDVTSPTYSIANTYACDRGDVFHIDAYRLKSERDFELLGLDEYFDTAFVFIEWGSRVQSLFPSALHLQISVNAHNQTGRQFRFSASQSDDLAMLDTLSQEFMA